MARHRLVVGMLLFAGTVLWGGVLAPGVLAMEPFCPGGSSPSPNVVLCDDFENGAFQTNWDIDSVWGTAFEFVLCILNGFGFRDGCAAWSNELVFDNEWGFYGYDAWRPFDTQSEFYVRWYQYISVPYDESLVHEGCQAAARRSGRLKFSKSRGLDRACERVRRARPERAGDLESDLTATVPTLTSRT